MNAPIDRDDQATWRQLRDRLREIREWADGLAAHGDGITAVRWAELTGILDRPREAPRDIREEAGDGTQSP